ncbi:MAG: hypothetical protein ACK5HT_16320, partial [Draconibacterium sp.]
MHPDGYREARAAFEETIKIIDCPTGSFNFQQAIEQMIAFNGKVIIQTLFIRGSFKGQALDNTTEAEISAWLELLKKINPRQVMIYTSARDTPVDTLHKVSLKELNAIAERAR